MSKRLILVFIALWVLIIIGVKWFETDTTSFVLEEIKQSIPVKNKTIQKYSPISINKLFDGIFEYQPSSMVQITETGDLMPGRMVNVNSQKSYMWAYKNILSDLKKYENIFINLESPIISECPLLTGGMLFCADPLSAKALSESNIKFASLANNHILNFGSNGLDETKSILDHYNIKHTGVVNPMYFEEKGLKIALLGFNDVECYPKFIECMTEENVAKDIKAAKENSDIVIVMFHWGSEYTYKPSTRQLSFAHLSIDSGADLVVGNHPHWYQEAEIYNDHLIVYSHGNFIFDQMWSQNTREGIVGQYAFDKNGLVDANFTPIYISNYGQPEVSTGGAADKIIKNFEKISVE